MRKTFTLLLAILISCSVALAQTTSTTTTTTTTNNTEANAETKSAKKTRKVHAFEIEIGIGAALGADNLKFDKTKTGFNGLAEIRYNFICGLDIGLQASINGFNRQTLNAEALKFLSKNAFFVMDYNILQDKGLSIFLGVGAGAQWNKNTGESTDEYANSFLGKNFTFCVMPRVGIELFHRVRVTLDYKFGDKANRHFGLSAGFVLGGGKK